MRWAVLLGESRRAGGDLLVLLSGLSDGLGAGGVVQDAGDDVRRRRAGTFTLDNYTRLLGGRLRPQHPQQRRALPGRGAAISTVVVGQCGLRLLAPAVPRPAAAVRRRCCWARPSPGSSSSRRSSSCSRGCGLLNSRASMIFVYVAISIPFSIYLLVGYLRAVPRSLDEAAVIDGATCCRSSGGSSSRSCCPASSPPRPMPSCCAGRSTCSRSRC